MPEGRGDRAAAAGPGADRPLRILVVDDDRVNRVARRTPLEPPPCPGTEPGTVPTLYPQLPAACTAIEIRLRRALTA